MAAGYVKASGQPAIVMEAAVVGLTNALGQMFNAWKEQTPLVFYSYRTEESLAAGRDGFEELPGQEQLTEPMTKLTWSARAPGQIPETVRRAFRVAWTPPYGPTYMNWHSDFTAEKFTAEIIRHDQVDPRMRVGRTRWRCSARQSCSSKPGVRCSSSATRSTRRRRSTRSCSSRSCWRCR